MDIIYLQCTSILQSGISRRSGLLIILAGKLSSSGVKLLIGSIATAIPPRPYIRLLLDRLNLAESYLLFLFVVVYCLPRCRIMI